MFTLSNEDASDFLIKSINVVLKEHVHLGSQSCGRLPVTLFTSTESDEGVRGMCPLGLKTGHRAAEEGGKETAVQVAQ